VKKTKDSWLVQAGVRFTHWSEKWIPDSFIFALLATFLVFFFSLIDGSHDPLEIITIWGNSFWDLIPFTLQMCLIIITGYVAATSPLMYRLIEKITRVSQNPKVANTLVAFFAMSSSWFNWGFSLVFSAVLAKEMAKRVKGLDYRATAASAFLGLGSIWAQGLSGSAVLQMATRGALQPNIRQIVEAGGLIPNGMIHLGQTVFLWQSIFSVIVEIVMICALVYAYTPSGSRAVTAKDLGIRFDTEIEESLKQGAHTSQNSTISDRLENSRIMSFLIALLGVIFIFNYFRKAENPVTALNLNIINFILLTVGIILQGTPRQLMKAVKEATAGVWGVILQFPFYAGIAGVIVHTHLNDRLAHFFVGISNQSTFPAIAAFYSMLLGVFVPSGGSKWVIEAPYMMEAAHQLKVHLGWVVTAYDLGEALANLVQPFWMLPTLGILGLKPKDVMGYTFLVFVVLAPIVFILLTVLSKTLVYPLG
jgi:short-chain fatty acids transporter